jgi:hypothetical protein
MTEIIPSKLQEWRQKAADGTITIEEMREAIAAIRQERIASSMRSSASREGKAAAKAKAKPIDSEALLGELL